MPKHTVAASSHSRCRLVMAQNRKYRPVITREITPAIIRYTADPSSSKKARPKIDTKYGTDAENKK